ncbi:hypothetical protein [Pontibacter akesuensis]|uniref:Uncharacterized protein n=1 Tax=Pontibacter akesuensis TaxID=388950 RepID=A0A1I7K392_9BACT|nr:hypothetical protein [Pontibacter akesuensis]GHA75402.1 hypothetical protein GCM10007389_31580 [Pontibacter akesuensis]SFU91916.1 hypothetical protein SAMN04487941_3345 [Pontibacter akesuensis]
MGLLHLLAVILVISAFFAYINKKYTKLPNPIGLLLLSLVVQGLILEPFIKQVSAKVAAAPEPLKSQHQRWSE